MEPFRKPERCGDEDGEAVGDASGECGCTNLGGTFLLLLFCLSKNEESPASSRPIVANVSHRFPRQQRTSYEK